MISAFWQCFKFQSIVLFLGMLALAAFGSAQDLLGWVIGAAVALIGPGLLQWRLRPAFDGWPARMWLWRLYSTVAIKWLLAASLLALYFMSGQARMVWLGLGYSIMIMVQCMAVVRYRL